MTPLEMKNVSMQIAMKRQKDFFDEAAQLSSAIKRRIGYQTTIAGLAAAWMKDYQLPK
jgi:hypothetical protein